MACDRCGARVPDASLSLNADAQYLCRTCFAAHLVAEADKRARTTQVFRRCRCGAVLSPIGDMTIDRTYPGDDGVLSDVEHLLPPRRYWCAQCRNHFTVRHLSVVVRWLPSFPVAALLLHMDDPRLFAIGVATGCAGLAMTIWLLAPRFRFPRVR